MAFKLLKVNTVTSVKAMARATGLEKLPILWFSGREERLQGVRGKPWSRSGYEVDSQYV
jgi:hypothetical protein